MWCQAVVIATGVRADGWREVLGLGAAATRMPKRQSLLRPASVVLVEADDEWQTTDRRYLSKHTVALLAVPGRGSRDRRAHHAMI